MRCSTATAAARGSSVHGSRLSGISVGLAVASKWSGVLILPALLPLLVAWAPAGHRRRQALIAAGWLIALPLVVYTASYVGRLHTGIAGWPHAFARRQLHMLRFHADLSGDNQYQSRPWEWLPIRRPVAYYFSAHGDRYREVIAIGSPFVWWTGAAGVLAGAWTAIRARSVAGAEAVVAACAAATYLPWLLLAWDRGFVFITYLLPTVPFLCLGATLLARRLWVARPGRVAVSVVVAAVRRLVRLLLPGAHGASASGRRVAAAHLPARLRLGRHLHAERAGALAGHRGCTSKRLVLGVAGGQMIDSTSCATLGLVWAVPDATIALEQASSSLPCERSCRLEHPIRRPAATHPVESTIYAARCPPATASK